MRNYMAVKCEYNVNNANLTIARGNKEGGTKRVGR